MTYTTRQYQAVLHCLERRPDAALTAADLAEALRLFTCAAACQPHMGNV